MLIGVRGTLEAFDPADHGMGPTLAGIATRVGDLVKRTPNWHLEHLGLDYPAAALRYWQSRSTGARLLTDLVADQAALPSRPDIVLIGLSQGADVVRRAVISPRVAAALPRIRAVVLLGDPTRDPRDGAWHHGTDDQSRGLLARWATPLPEQLSNQAWSFCLDGDQVAANHNGWLAMWRSGTHTRYADNEGHAQDRAAAFVAEQLR